MAGVPGATPGPVAANAVAQGVLVRPVLEVAEPILRADASPAEVPLGEQVSQGGLPGRVLEANRQVLLGVQAQRRIAAGVDHGLPFPAAGAGLVLGPAPRANEGARSDGPQAVGARGAATKGTVVSGRPLPHAAPGLSVEPDGAEGAAVTRKPVPLAPSRDAVGQAVHAPLVTAPRDVVRLRVAGVDGEVVPTGHLAETTLLVAAPGQTPAAHEDLDGAAVGGPTLEGRQAEAPADQVGGQVPGLDGASRGAAPRRRAANGPAVPAGRRTGAGLALRVLVVPKSAGPNEGALRPVLGHAVHTAPSVVAPGVAPRRPRRARRAGQDQTGQVGAKAAALLGLGARPVGATPDEARPARVHVAAGPSAAQDTASDGEAGGVTPTAPARTAALDHEAQAHPRAAAIREVGGAPRGHEASLGRLLFLNVHYFE